MKKQLKIFAWDFHGTLEQGGEVGFTQILKKLAREHKLDVPVKLTAVKRLFGKSITDYLRHFFPTVNDELIARMRLRIAEEESPEYFLKYFKPTPHAVEVLKEIGANGHKNIVVSNSGRTHLAILMKTLGMVHLFDEIFGIDRHYLNFKADTVSEKTKAILKYAREHKFGPEQIVVIGDRKPDIDVGILIGATTYQYKRRGLMHDKTEATYKISDLRELLREI